MAELQLALQNALIPFAATLFGGAIALFKTPSAVARSAIQHFAAGVVFSAISLELLPELIGKHAPVSVMVGFSGGILSMLAIKALTAKLSAFPRLKMSGAGPVGMMVVVAVDIFIDGLLIGIGFAAGETRGKMLSMALTLELLFLGLAAASGLAAAAVGRGKIILATLALGCLVVVGILVGAVPLGSLSGPMLAGLLAFGAAALLYLVTEELLVEAHEVPETPWLTGAFFLGFLMFLELGMNAGS